MKMTDAMKLKTAGMVLDEEQLEHVVGAGVGVIYAQTKWRFCGVEDEIREGAEKLLKK